MVSCEGGEQGAMSGTGVVQRWCARGLLPGWSRGVRSRPGVLWKTWCNLVRVGAWVPILAWGRRRESRLRTWACMRNRRKRQSLGCGSRPVRKQVGRWHACGLVEE